MVVHDNKSLVEKETLLQILEELIPEKMRWRLEVLEIIAQSGGAITGYKIVKKLTERGFTGTRVSSVYPFLNVLEMAGLCKRPEGAQKFGYRGVEITEKGREVARLLRVLLTLDSSSLNNQ